MTADVIFAYVHFFAIGCLVAVLAMETVLLKDTLDAGAIRRLARIDLGYGISAAVLILAGIGRVSYGLKGPAFYQANPVFWIKMALFAAVGLISVFPTLQFIAWRKASARDGGFRPQPEKVHRVRTLIKLQWVLFAFIPLAAILMARGVGM